MSTPRKTPLIGIIGGMGTQATAYFYEVLYKKQSVTVEQELFDALVYSIPSAPDRTAFITGKTQANPYKSIVHAAKTLENAGASLLTLLCVTAHFFYDDLKSSVSIPLLNIPEETALCAAKRSISKVGLLATDGALKGKVFHTAFEKRGIEIIIPSPALQSELMTLIYDIKLGSAVPPLPLDTIVQELQTSGVELIILGCTDLCISGMENPDHINVLDLLADAVLVHSGAIAAPALFESGDYL